MNKLTKSELIEKLEDLPGRGTVINVDTLQDVYIEAVKHCVSLINNTEIIPDPVPAVDTELEEAKKLVGTWVKIREGYTAFLVKQVERCRGGVFVSNDVTSKRIEHVEPFPLPITAAKWRCMKTDIEYSCDHRLICLDCGHSEEYCTGWYNVANKAWCVNNQYIDLSCYETFEWLEIPRGE